MKIIRDGRIVFVVGLHVGIAFNLDTVSKIVVDDWIAQKNDAGERLYYITVWAGAETSVQVTHDEARQMFSDTPWVKVLPPRKA